MTAPRPDPSVPPSAALGDSPSPCTDADAAHWLATSGVLDGAIRRGEMIPDFELANTAGNRLSEQTLLDQGPVVIVFTLGGRSPLCRRALRDLQAGLAEITASGASVVAITPDPPATSRVLRREEGLGFELLADDAGRLAALFGIAYTPPLPVAAWLTLLGVDPAAEWARHDVPLPAAFVVTPDGIAQMAFVPADPRDRIVRAQVLAALSALSPGAASTGAASTAG